MDQPEYSFASPRELFGALSSDDPLERRRVLGWIATHPDEAIALGADGGRDIVDVLIGLVDTDTDYGYWEDVAIALGAFDAPRVTEFFVGALALATEPEAAFDAASALARRQRSSQRDRLVEILISEGPPERAVAVAELLVGEPDLPAAAAVRLAILEEDREPPALTDATLDAWISELAGPFASEARDGLERQGEAAFRALSDRWEDLDDEDRGWLVGRVSSLAPGLAGPVIAQALESGSDELALTALRRAEETGAEGIDPALLVRWAEHTEPVLRAAAIAAGAPVPARALDAPEGEDPRVVAAAIRRAPGSVDDRAAATIASHLTSTSPEVRSAARDALVALGPAAVERLRPLVRSSNPEARAAAVRALLDLGDDEWLAAELLKGDAPG